MRSAQSKHPNECCVVQVYWLPAFSAAGYTAIHFGSVLQQSRRFGVDKEKALEVFVKLGMFEIHRTFFSECIVPRATVSRAPKKYAHHIERH